MAHKSLIGGTAYEITGGKTLVDGTAYEIEKGRALVDGTALEIVFSNGATVIVTSSVSDTSDQNHCSLYINGEEKTDWKTGYWTYENVTSVSVSAKHSYKGAGYTKINLDGETVAKSTIGVMETISYEFTPETPTVNIDYSGENGKYTIEITTE